MKKITVTITDAQHVFLSTLKHEDAASNQSQAVMWAIDSCRLIGHNYNENGSLDACYVAFHDIRKEGHPEFEKVIIDTEYPGREEVKK